MLRPKSDSTMSKRPPHGGKPPKPRTPTKKTQKKEVLIIDDIDDALRRVWQTRKLRRK